MYSYWEQKYSLAGNKNILLPGPKMYSCWDQNVLLLGPKYTLAGTKMYFCWDQKYTVAGTKNTLAGNKNLLLLGWKMYFCWDQVYSPPFRKVSAYIRQIPRAGQSAQRSTACATTLVWACKIPPGPQWVEAQPVVLPTPTKASSPVFSVDMLRVRYARL